MNVYIHAKHYTEIKDFPYYPRHRQGLVFHYHRYKCRESGQNFSDTNVAEDQPRPLQDTHTGMHYGHLHGRACLSSKCHNKNVKKRAFKNA